MAEALDIEEDMVPVLEVRILDETKKSSFRVRRLTNFPIAENIDEMKSALQTFMPDVKHVENWQIGYVLERNKKYVIESTGELQHAWQHLKKGYQMWLDPSPMKVEKKRSGTSIEGI